MSERAPTSKDLATNEDKTQVHDPEGNGSDTYVPPGHFDFPCHDLTGHRTLSEKNNIKNNCKNGTHDSTSQCIGETPESHVIPHGPALPAVGSQLGSHEIITKTPPDP